jgi:hypothetical protein
MGAEGARVPWAVGGWSYTTVTMDPRVMYGQMIEAAVSGSSTHPRLCGSPYEVARHVVEGVAAVEIRHELHRVGVGPAVGIGAPHDLVPQAQVDRERTEGGRGASPAGVGRRDLDDDPVVPHGERFRVGFTRQSVRKAVRIGVRA